MKIKYNKKITEREKMMFELAKEFVFKELKQKEIFDKLTVDIREYSSKKYGLSHIAMFEIYKEIEFSPRISLYNYGMKLRFNAYVLSGYKSIKTLEQYRYIVFFHELGHLVDIYNVDDDAYEKELNSRGRNFTQDKEDDANEISLKFLVNKGIVKDEGDLFSAINSKRD